MELVVFLLSLIVGSIGVQSIPTNQSRILQDAAINSDDIPLEMELALESVRQEDTSKPVEQQCLKLGVRCRNSKLSCCKTQTLKGGGILTTNGVCFLFGEGKCEARVNIPNYDRYIELAKKVKKSNYKRLRCEYWKDILSPFFYRSLLKNL